MGKTRRREKMSEKKIIKPVALAVGAALAGTFAISGTVNADSIDSPFEMSSLSVGYMLGEGEGSCGGDKGEGSCGEKDGEGSLAATKKVKEATRKAKAAAAKLATKKVKVVAAKVLAAVTKKTRATRKMPKVAVVKVLAVVLSKNTTPYT